MRVQLPLPPATADESAPAPACTNRGVRWRCSILFAASPGVRSASLTTSVPLADASAIFYSAEGMTGVDATNRPRAYTHRITPGHFETLGMRFTEGRDFALAEMGLDSTAVIVSREGRPTFLARPERQWAGESSAAI